MGELLLDEVGARKGGGIGMGMGIMGGGEAWSIEKRFRVTEVFLAVLWVCGFHSVEVKRDHAVEDYKRGRMMCSVEASVNVGRSVRGCILEEPQWLLEVG